MSVLDLGHLDLESAACGLHLRLHSAAQLAPSGKDDLDQLRTRLTAYKLSLQKDKIPFISTGDRLILTIQLQLDSEVARRAPAQEVVHLLSLQLREAELWKLLDFSTPCVTTSECQQDHYHIRLVLRHADELPPKPKPKLHKLDTDVPSRDVRPPQGVPHARLNDVQLDLTVTPFSPKPAKPEQLKITSRLEHTPSTDVNFDGLDDDLLLDEAGSVPVDDLMLDEVVEDAHHGPAYLAFDDHPLVTDVQSDEFILHKEAISYMEANLQHGSVPGFSEDTHNLKDTIEYSAHTITELIMLGIDAAIARPPRKRRKDIVAERGHIHTLASIAPSVWLPGYLGSVATRSVFLPTLCHALSNLISATDRGSLSRTAAKIVDDYSSAGSKDQQHFADTIDQGRVSSSMHHRLWNIVQARAHDSCTKRLSKLLLMPTTSTPTRFTSSADMLQPSDEDEMLHGSRLDEESSWLVPNEDDEESKVHDLLDLEDSDLAMFQEDSDIFDMQEYEDAYAAEYADEECWSTNIEFSQDSASETIWQSEETQTAASVAIQEVMYDDDMQSVCSSVEMLALPDYDKVEDDGDGYYWQGMSQMLCI